MSDLISKYNELNAMTAEVAAKAQEAYRFARDNKLCFDMPKLVRDNDDRMRGCDDDNEDCYDDYDDEDDML